jgi:RNA polymerase sigma-70 factor (ECF subfamily)
VQETFLRAWRSFDDLRDDGKAKSWLMTTVRRAYARQFEGYQPEFIDIEPDGVDGHGGSLSINLEVQELRRAIARLPERYREPLALQVIGGYSGEEIADMLEQIDQAEPCKNFRPRAHLQANAL